MPKETSPPAVQTLQTSTTSAIRHRRKPQTVEITPSPEVHDKTIYTVLPRQDGEWIPHTREVQPLGHPRHHKHGHPRSHQRAQRRQSNQDRSPGLLHRPPGEQTLVTHQGATSIVPWLIVLAYKQVGWAMVQQYWNAKRGSRHSTDQHSVLV